MIKMVVAVSNSFGIGYEGDLLFHNKTDLKRFQELTMGNFIVMGRKTYESLPKYLDGRTHVVLTRDKNYKPKDSRVIVEHDVKKVLNYYLNTGEQDKDLCVIGGNEIYKLFFPYADEVYLTFFDKEVEEVDTYFPLNKLFDFKLDKESQVKLFAEKEECLMLFNKYVRINEKEPLS